MEMKSFVLSLLVFSSLKFQCSCGCPKPTGTDFNCYDEFGEPVSSDQPIPAWGLCERTNCEKDGKYPNPLSVLCDGDTDQWTPSSPDTIVCVDSTAVIISGGYGTTDIVTGISSKKTCQLAKFDMTQLQERMWHTMDYDETNEMLFVCGGNTTTARQCITLDLRIPSASWIPIKAKMTDSRNRHASAIDSKGRKLYVTGGHPLGGGRPLDTAEVLDLDLLTWKSLPNMKKAAVERHCSVIFEESSGSKKLYNIGGVLGDMKEIHELDLTNQAAEWIQKLGSLQTPRENHACMVYKDYIIISGGNDLLASEKWDSVERYSPKYDVTVYMPPLNKARGQHIMASLDGRPTVMAGSGANVTEKLLELEKYNEIKDIWEVIPNVQLPFENGTWGAAGVGNVPISLVIGCE